MKNNLFFVTGIILLFTSCSPQLTSVMLKTYPSLQYQEEVRIFEVNEPAPSNAEKLGTVRVGDSGFSVNCNYSTVLDMTIIEARKVGGNAVKITQHKLPDFLSTCHRITADVLRIESNELSDEIPAPIGIHSVANSGDSIPKIPVIKAKFPHFRIAADGGWQYRLARLASGMDAFWQEHYKKMKSGFHYDIQVAYFFVENHGIEIMFSQQFFNNTLKNIILYDETGNVIAFGILKEKNMFNYAGANYIVRFFNAKKKNYFSMTFGLGYLGYIDKLILNDDEFSKITAATFGVNCGLGYDIGISKDFGIGLKLSFMGGTFRNYKLTQGGITTNETLPEKTPEGLGTIKLSVGLRFNK